MKIWIIITLSYRTMLVYEYLRSRCCQNDCTWAESTVALKTSRPQIFTYSDLLKADFGISSDATTIIYITSYSHIMHQPERSFISLSFSISVIASQRTAVVLKSRNSSKQEPLSGSWNQSSAGYIIPALVISRTTLMQSVNARRRGRVSWHPAT